ncbi:MAG: DUF4230 domain-containing protein [Bryobacterales bacterium]|jgi:hypothetical protein|nr:DUF4230 domain-containing protein [Bryobacterales bacterium]
MPQRPILLWILAALTLFLAGVALVLLSDGMPDQHPARKAINPPAILTQVRGMRELVTVKYGIQKVVALEEKKVPFGAERLLLFVQAEVAAGVDLSQMREDDVALLPNGAVAISLPPASITSVTVDDQHTRVWDRSVTWWTPWVPYNQDLERQARLVAKADCESGARQMGILPHARRNAEEAIRALLLAAGASEVRFLDKD